MLDTTELFYTLALAHSPGLKPLQARLLLQHFGSAQAVFEAGAALQTLAFLRRGTRALQGLLGQESLGLAERQLRWLEGADCQVLRFDQAAYPARLHTEAVQAPFLLYYRGEVKALQALKSVGCVGTRQPSEYGRMACERILTELSGHKCLIVSGLAYGIDATAHEMALHLGLPTVALVAHGLDMVYPAAHRKLAQRMVAQGGGILSEFPIRTRPAREHFPMRNRLIAGLSDALLLMESGLRGGSMITVEQALEQGKRVFALPGRIFDENALGCHALLAQGKAYLLQSAETICLALGWDLQQENKQGRLHFDLEPNAQALINQLLGGDILSLEQLQLRLAWPSALLHSTLLELELEGLIKVLPGKNYRIR